MLASTVQMLNQMCLKFKVPENLLIYLIIYF